jgi:DNA-binding transcriptional regulator YdaS (Cro superfamily)
MNIKELTKGLLTVRQVAELCSLSVQAIYKWEKSERIPAEYCRTIERATNGQVTRYELRPDVFGKQTEEAA